MKTRNLASALKGKKKGWIAINEKNEVVVHALTFDAICKKVGKIKQKLTLLPVASDYSGYQLLNAYR